MDTGNEPTVPAEPPEDGPDTGTPTPSGPADPHGLRMRDGRHRFARNPARAALDARAAELRAQGWTYQRIADELGYATKTGALDAVRRAVREVVQGPAERLVALHIERLETLYERALAVAERQHVVVSHGKIMYGEDGNPLIDSGPELAALREARTTLESFWKLAGIARPDKVEHSGGVTYQVVGIQPEDVV
ncbi:hypothetical protein [Streptomyces viridochromogenes]|uniref:hypothetical protein n=1 Tax=Streptomyces viridochromogenes TaxID=1938 RepID=UPI00069FB8CF|nr:hypothetical protein [Streptomyces viridochromogenes]KOG21795.1 hypothetical protein ADK36_12530 [Streptomyces viridochromogenes]